MSIWQPGPRPSWVQALNENSRADWITLDADELVAGPVVAQETDGAVPKIHDALEASRMPNEVGLQAFFTRLGGAAVAKPPPPDGAE